MHISTFLWPALAMAQLVHQQRPEDSRSARQYQADCNAGLSLSACGTIPVSKDCDSGKHWSLDGVNYAHCVADDMDCPGGTRLEHDVLGTPSCRPIDCGSGQSLSGATCVPDIVPTVPALPVTALPVPGFNGMAFGAYSYSGPSLAALNIPASASYAKMNLILNTGNGNWIYSSTYPVHPLGCCAPVTTPNSGTWTTTPTARYEYRISSVVYGPYNPQFPTGQNYNVSDTRNYWTGLVPFPASATGWTVLPANSLVAVAGINMDLVNGCSYVADANFPLSLRYTLQLRNADEPTAISTAAFDLVFHFTNNTSCSAG